MVSVWRTLNICSRRFGPLRLFIGICVCVIYASVSFNLPKKVYIPSVIKRLPVLRLYNIEGDECAESRKRTFLSPPGPLTALVSYPGAGNTWARYLIEQMTGYYTGSIYNDSDLRDKGFLGEHIRDGRVVAVKSHGPHIQNFKRAILVIRNPYRALLSEFSRRSTGGHMGNADMNNFMKS